MIDYYKKLFLSQFMLYMGGGGDPGAINRWREDARNAEIKENRRRVNEIFDGKTLEGVGSNPVNVFEPGTDYYDATGKSYDPISANVTYNQDLDKYNNNPDPVDVPATYRDVRGVKTLVNDGVGQGKGAPPIAPGQAYSQTSTTGGGGFNEEYFDKIADAYMKFQTPLLEQQIGEARRKLPSNFGSTRSSAYQRQKNFLEKDYAREQVDIADRGQDFTNQQRIEIERNRSDLLSMANSSTDSSAIASQANARTLALRKPPTFSPIGDLFQKYTKSGSQALQSEASGQVYNNLNYGAQKGSVRNVT